MDSLALCLQLGRPEQGDSCEIWGWNSSLPTSRSRSSHAPIRHMFFTLTPRISDTCRQSDSLVMRVSRGRQAGVREKGGEGKGGGGLGMGGAWIGSKAYHLLLHQRLRQRQGWHGCATAERRRPPPQCQRKTDAAQSRGGLRRAQVYGKKLLQ